MPIAKIKMADGRVARVEVPEGTTPEQVMEFVRQQTAKPAPAPSAPPAAPEQPPSVVDDMSGAERFFAGAGAGFDTTARGLDQHFTNIYNAPRAVMMKVEEALRSQFPNLYGGGPGPNEKAGFEAGPFGSTSEELQAAEAEARKLNAPLLRTPAGLAGNITGTVAANSWMPPARSLPAMVMTGGMFGAAQPTVSPDEITGNVGAGMAGGAMGRAAAGLINTIARPVKSAGTAAYDALVDKARQMGIPLTVGQITNSRPVQIAESAVQNIPVIGRPVRDLRQRQLDKFHQLLGSTFGSTGDDLSTEAIRDASASLSRRFEQTFDGVKVPVSSIATKLNAIDVDPKLLANKDFAKLVTFIDDLTAKINPSSKLGGGDIDGKAYQAWRTRAQNFQKTVKDDWLGTELGKVIRAVDDAAYEAVPDQAALAALRGEYRNMKILEPLLKKAATGEIPPGQLMNRVAHEVGNVHQGGGGTLADLARIGKAVVKDQVPDSGTAQRQMMTNLLTGGGLAAGGAAIGSSDDMSTSLRNLALFAVLGAAAGKGLSNPTIIKYLSQGIPDGGQMFLSRLADPAARAVSLAPLVGNKEN